jgi:uronate dehydrogenase
MLKTKASPLTFPRLLLTGAAGQLGQEMRPRLKAYCDVLRVSDQKNLGNANIGEEVCLADLADAQEMQTLLTGVDAVVHLGGISTEQPWAPILASNIVGMVNLYEAARLQGTLSLIHI